MPESAARPRVLFLCTGNSCRSQMAEGFLHALYPDSCVALSAGTNPHGKNPHAVAVMAEAGIDISQQDSQDIADFAADPPDLVITVCDHAAQNCPVFPGTTRVVHQPFDDPPKLAADAPTPDDALNCYRQVRDQIRAYIAATDFPALLRG